MIARSTNSVSAEVLFESRIQTVDIEEEDDNRLADKVELMNLRYKVNCDLRKRQSYYLFWSHPLNWTKESGL